MYFELIAAFFGTLFFSMLFSCHRKFLFLSGLNGLIAWFIYLFTLKNTSSLVFANFWATAAVVLFAQAISLRRRVPLDVFLIPGIFVLVPGATIYKMFFAFISHQDKLAIQAFKETISIGFSIAMAIFIFVFVFEKLNKAALKQMSAKALACPDSTGNTCLTAVEIGKLMLENGAETHKVEETIDMFCHINGLTKVQSFVIPTGIFVTFLERKNHPVTELVRIFRRGLNLGRIAEIVEALNSYYAERICYSDFLLWLREIKSRVYYKKIEMCFAAAFAVASFSVLFKGNWHELSISFAVGFFAQFFIDKMADFEFPAQLINIMASAFICFASYCAARYCTHCRPDILITSSVMLLVPGVTIINALREIIAGDLVSGSARGFEALIVAASIASGVGVMLKILN